MTISVGNTNSAPGSVTSQVAGIESATVSKDGSITTSSGAFFPPAYSRTAVFGRQYRSFESLPEEAWRHVDSTIIRVQQESLVGIADLNSFPSTNMSYDGMSSSVFTMKKASRIGEATAAVTPDKASDSGREDFHDLSVPMYVVYKDFVLNDHQTSMANSINLPLAMILVEEATRSVTRKLEEMLFVGGFRANGAESFSYTTFPGALPYTITDWLTTQPDDIMKQVNGMMSESLKKHHRGPWILYIPWDYQIRLNEDYHVGAGDYPVAGSIRSRLMELPGLLSIRISHYMPSSTAVLVEMTNSTVILINAMEMQAVAWEPPGTPYWDHKFKVMTMAIPMMIDDYDSNCGIVKGTV